MRETDRQEPEEEERTSLAILRVLPLRAPIIQSEFVAQASKTTSNHARAEKESTRICTQKTCQCRFLLIIFYE